MGRIGHGPRYPEPPINPPDCDPPISQIGEDILGVLENYTTPEEMNDALYDLLDWWDTSSGDVEDMGHVYLCGGINALTDEQCNDWREYVMAQLPTLAFLNPMRRDYRGKEDQMYSRIMSGDIRDIILSQLILVNATRPSWGTAMEIVYAKLYGKPIIVFTGNAPISPWLRCHCTGIVGSIDEAIAWIIKYFKASEPWKLRRGDGGEQ